MMFFIFASGLAHAKEQKPIITENEALFVLENLLGQGYGFKLPELEDGSMNSTYFFKQQLEAKINKSIKKEMNSNNLGLYFLNTYADYVHGSYHGVFKAGIYDVFLINPKKFFEILSTRSNNLMLPGICGMIGTAYYDHDNDWMNGLDGVKPGYEFQAIHKKELAYLSQEFRESCIKMINGDVQR